MFVYSKNPLNQNSKIDVLFTHNFTLNTTKDLDYTQNPFIIHLIKNIITSIASKTNFHVEEEKDKKSQNV